MLPPDLVPKARAQGLPPEAGAATLAAWVSSAPAARPYFFYLKWMYETFHAIAECFPKEGGRAGTKDAVPMGTSPEELLLLANHLYLLTSHGVPGAVLECGCFKGFSTCCLSHACDLLGRELVVADSFQGLPPPRADEASFYEPGDFQGTLAEVQANVQTFGRPSVVHYREGWFRDSLPGWSRPLALLWLDVDLYDSTLDVLTNVFPALDPRGALFSHEFLPDRIANNLIVHSTEPPGALHHYLSTHGFPYRATHLAGHTALLTFPPSPITDTLIPHLLPHLRDADHRARAAREAIGLKAGLRDLAKRARTHLIPDR